MKKAKMPLAMIPLAVGPTLGYSISRDLKEPYGWKWIAVGALIGGVIALLMFFLDPKPSYSGSDGDDVSIAYKGSLLGRFFAVLSLLFPLSFLALIFGIVALILNWRVRGWPWYASLIGTILSAATSIVVVIVIANVKSR